MMQLTERARVSIGFSIITKVPFDHPEFSKTMTQMDDFYIDPNQMRKKSKTPIKMNNGQKGVNSKVIDINKSLLSQ